MRINFNEIKEGQTIIAKIPCAMIDANANALIPNKKYEIIIKTQSFISIKSEIDKIHSFPKEKINTYFKI